MRRKDWRTVVRQRASKASGRQAYNGNKKGDLKNGMFIFGTFTFSTLAALMLCKYAVDA